MGEVQVGFRVVEVNMRPPDYHGSPMMVYKFSQRINECPKKKLEKDSTS